MEQPSSVVRGDALHGEQLSTGLYREIVESSPDGIWVFDLDGRITYANARVAEMFGVPQEGLAGLTVFDTLDGVGQGQFREHLRQLRAGHYNGDEVEVQFVRRDRSVFWVSVQESPLHDPAGSLVGVVHRMSDYSRRRAAMDELRASRAELAEAQRLARLGSWTWDVSADRVVASEQFSQLFGIPPEDLPRSLSDFLELVHPADRDSVVTTVAGAIEQGDEFEYVARVHVPEGWRWARARGVVQRHADGTISMSGTHQDVTEVTRARRDLEDQVRQNTLLQAIATSANEAATLSELLPRCRELLLAHDAWDRARAFVPDESGAPVPLHVTDSDRTADLAAPEEAAGEATLAARVLHTRRPVWDDRRLTIAFPVHLGQEICAVITMTSRPPLHRHELIEAMAEQVAVQIGRVAERELVQQELADARDQAMAASRQKSDFLATMSHEIRTPLNGIIGLTDLLVRSGLDPSRHRLASGVQLAGRTLLSLINDILDFSKIEAGRLELERVGFEVREVLDQLAGILAEPAREKGLELLVSCAADVPDQLCGDPTRLLQVLINLGSNAVKFTETGQVSVRASASSEGDRVRLRVEVHDTGPGIESARLPALFEPFTQGDASTTRLHGGTGLGLAISREIVQAMEGTLEVRSEPGVGSTFGFSALLDPPDPLAEDTEGPIGADARARAALAGHRVLVVDDLPERRSLLAEQLAHWEVRATGAATVAQALRQVEDAAGAGTPYSLVIAGLAAPLDGELVRAVRRVEQDPHAAPVVLVQTWRNGAGPSGRSEGPELPEGVADVLSRPVLTADLRGTLLRLLDGEQPEDASRRGDAPVTGRSRRVLVVEDNPVNQLVAVGLLEAHGYLADLAADGVEALSVYDPEKHDVVLMDVQMPRMDGYTASRELRLREEQGPPGHRVPIIAMTASAVDGERERCVSAGMDDYLTKPVDPGALAAMLARWLADEEPTDRATGPAAASPPSTTPPPSPSRQEPPVTASTPDPIDTLDLARLEMLRDLDPGNTTYLDRAIGNFCTNSVTALETIRAAVAAGDAAGLRQAAHKLAGGALNLGVPGAAAAARELEFLGDAGTTEGGAARLQPLEQALADGRAALRAYQAEHTEAGRRG